jgi:transcription elongation factor Elf1
VPEVTCPSCHTHQEVGDAAGYTCVSCGTAWAFATCENCAVRFHMRPGTTAWTCPECGHENGTAVMVDLGAEPDLAPEPVQVPELEAASEPEPEPAARPSAPRHAAPPPVAKGLSGPPTRAKLATIAVIGIAAVLVIAFSLSAFAGNGNGAETAASQSPPASSPTPAPSSSLTTTEQLCLHLRDLQLLRVDNYTRLAAELANDQAAIEASGDAKLAAAVTKMRAAVLAYRDALAAQADTSAANAQLIKANKAMPCS